MKNFLFLSVLSLIFILGGCKETIDEPNFDDNLAKKRLSISGVMDATAIVDPGTMITTVNGSGYLSYLGNFTSISTAKINPTGTPPGITGEFYDGQHTAVNEFGDEMYTEWTGSWQVINPNPYTVHYIMEMIITGGTGPFENAAGQINIECEGTGVGPFNLITIHINEVSGYLEFNDLVPFKGDVAGPSVPTTACGGLGRKVELYGEVTHFGNMSSVMTHCNYLLSLPQWGLGGELRGGQAVLTANNGDELYFNYSGRFKLDAYPPTYSDVFVSGIITGGTGKYANATGVVCGIGRQDDPLGQSCPCTFQITGLYRK